MRRVYLVSGAAASIFLLTVTLIYSFWGVIENSVRLQAERRVSEKFGGTLEIGALNLMPFRLRAEFSDLRLEIPAEEGESLVAELSRGVAGFPVSGLFSFPGGRIHLSELELHSPGLVVDRRFLENGPRQRSETGGAVDLRIDRLEIIDGSCLYGDRSIPLELSANDLTLRGAWDSSQRAITGQTSFRTVLHSPWFTDPYTVKIETLFSLRGSRLELSGMEAEAPGLVWSEGAGNISWDEGAFVTGSGNLSADLDDISALLDEKYPEMSGKIGGEIRLSRGNGTVQVRGRVEAESFALGPILADHATADLVYDPGRLRLHSIRASSMGGTVEGEVETVVSDDTVEVVVDVTGEKLDSGDVLAFVGRPLPIAGKTDLSVVFSGEPGDTSTWNASGDMHIAAAGDNIQTVPMKGAGRFDIHEGRLAMRSGELRSGPAKMRMTMELDLPSGSGLFELDGESSDAAYVQHATLKVLEALEVPPSDILNRRLEGRGTFGVRTILGENATVNVEIDLQDGSWSGERFEELGLGIDLHRDTLKLTRLVASGTDWNLTGHLTMNLESAAIVEADIEAADIPVSTLMNHAGLDFDVNGRLSGGIDLQGSERGLSGTGRIGFREGSLWGEPVDRGEAIISIEQDVAFLTDLFMEGPALRGKAVARIDLVSGNGTMDLLDISSSFGELLAVDGKGIDLEGTIHGEGRIEWEPGQGTQGSIDFRCDSWKFIDQEMEPFSGTILMGDRGAVLHSEMQVRKEWEFDGEVSWDEPLTAEAKLTLDGFRIDLMAEDDIPTAWVKLRGGIDLSGSLADLESLVVEGELDEVEVRVGGNMLAAVEPVKIAVGGGRVEVAPLRLEGAGSLIDASLGVTIDERALDASCKGHLDMGIMSLILPDTRSSGRLDVDLTIAGTVDDPRLAGSISATDGRVRLLGFPQTLDHVDLNLEIEEQGFRVERFQASLGGGELSGGGGIVLDGLVVDSYLFEVKVANVRVSYPEGFRGTYDGVLELHGDRETATLSGELELLRGIYSRGMDVAALLGIGTREYSVEEELELPVQINLDVGLHAGDNVWFRNEMAELETGFDLKFGGELKRPEVTGRLWVLEGGKLMFRDVDYTVRSGTLDFVELDRINPHINVRAVTHVDEYEVQLKIEGTLERFEYELTSTPTLTQQDIIALLVTGKTLQDVTAAAGAGGADFTGDLAAGYFAGALSSRFERQLQKLFGLERFQISPFLVRGADDPTTRITVGKEVADDLFLIYSTGLDTADRQLYQVEWQVTRKFRLAGERDTNEGVGGDFLYFNRFWLNRPEGDAREEAVEFSASGTGVEDKKSVSEVVLLGVEDEERLRMIRDLPLREGSQYKRSVMFEGSEALRRKLVNKGMIQAMVEARSFPEPEDENLVRIVYRIDPGPVVDVEMTGIRSKDEKKLRKRLLRLWADSLFTEYLFEDSKREIEEYFRERGHYAVDVRMVESDESTESRKILFHIDPGESVRVRNVTVDGNDGISDDRVLRQMLTRPSTVFSRKLFVPKTLEADLAAIRNMYRDQGYLTVKVLDPRVRLAIDGGTVDVEVRIEEGPRFTIERITVPVIEGHDSDEILAGSGLVAGEVFSRTRLIEAESAIRAWFDSDGYPDARVTGHPRIEGDRVTVLFEIKPGISKQVAAIEIEGNLRTRAKIVKRELLLDVGDPVSREKVLRSQHRLYKLGIFRNVRIEFVPISADDPSLQLLRVRVEEAPPVGMTVGAGYDSEEGVRGSFSISHDNVGGYDRTMAFHGRASGILERYDLLVEEPRLFTRKWPTLVNLLHERNEETGFTVNRSVGAIRVENRFAENWTAFLRYSFQKVDLFEISDWSQVLEQKLTDLKLGDLGYSIVRDTRDDPLAPTRGTYTSLTTRWFAPVFLSEESFVKSIFGSSYTRTLRGGSVYAGAIRLALARPLGSTKSVPLSERYFAGGDSTVRGFPRDALGPKFGDISGGISGQEGREDLPVGGEAMFIFNQEYRIPIWGRLKGVLFYDAGNVYLEIDDLRKFDIRHVLGAGLRVESPIGPLRFEYGRKLNRREGESRGEFFIAIGTAF